MEISLTVTLSWHEMFHGVQQGSARRISALKRKRRGRDDERFPRNEPWDTDTEGALAEMAVAKLLNVYWSGNTGNLRAADASRLQVRWTRYPNGCLPLHHEDADDDWFVLVTGREGNYQIVGVIQAREGKFPAYWREDLPYPCFMTPQSALSPPPASWFRQDVGGSGVGERGRAAQA